MIENTPEQIQYLYIASCDKEGGILQYRLYEDGSCELCGYTRLDRPMYMAADKRKMYIILRDPWGFRKLQGIRESPGIRESGVIVYDVDRNGALVNPSSILSTKGEVACHIMVNRGEIYCANYMSGSLIRLPDKLVRHTGQGIHPVRQEQPHVHFVGVTPDGKYICAADLGLDTIFLYDRNMKLHSETQVPSGHGVRHLAFSEDKGYMFSVNELCSTVSAFSYQEGELQLIDTCSAIPPSFTGENAASAIRIKDGYLYVSNRGHDSIAQIRFRNGRLTLLQNIDCHGKTPRDFIFTDKYLICANQDSNTVSVLKGDGDFSVRGHIPVKSPLCVCTMCQ